VATDGYHFCNQCAEWVQKTGKFGDDDCKYWYWYCDDCWGMWNEGPQKHNVASTYVAPRFMTKLRRKTSVQVSLASSGLQDNFVLNNSEDNTDVNHLDNLQAAPADRHASKRLHWRSWI